MDKLKIWLFIILDYLFKFGAPLGVAYWKFAIYKEGISGGLFYFISAIIFILFYIKIVKTIKKQKTSKTKVVFKWMLNSVTGVILYLTFLYIGNNFNELTYVILAWISGNFIGSILEWIVVDLDRNYIDEIGVI